MSVLLSKPFEICRVLEITFLLWSTLSAGYTELKLDMSESGPRRSVRKATPSSEQTRTRSSRLKSPSIESETKPKTKAQIGRARKRTMSPPAPGDDGSIIYRSRRSEPPTLTSAGKKTGTRMSGRQTAESPPLEAAVPGTSSEEPLEDMKEVKTPASQSDSDVFCWSCHAEGKMICCEVCPRVFHLRCVSLESEPHDGWTCPECLGVLQAETVEQCPKGMNRPSMQQLAILLRFALQRMKCQGSEPFQQPVDLQEFPHYRDYVFKPMDLSQLEKNVQAKGYGSTEAFVGDAKWILHNCMVFNGPSSKLTSIAKTIVKICRHEVNEIEICADCYFNSCTKKSQDWFCEPCRIPHSLVWAKMRGYPYWPAKALRVVDQQVDCRFFGEHDRAWVPISAVYMLSLDCPFGLRKKIQGLSESLIEMKKHIDLLILHHGAFHYAKICTPFDPNFQQQKFRRAKQTREREKDLANMAESSTASSNTSNEKQKTTSPTSKKRQTKQQAAVVQAARRLKKQYRKLKRPIARFVKTNAKEKPSKRNIRRRNRTALSLVKSNKEKKVPCNKRDLAESTEAEKSKKVDNNGEDESDQGHGQTSVEVNRESKVPKEEKSQGKLHSSVIEESEEPPKNPLLARVVDSCKRKLGINDEKELSIDREEGELSDSVSIADDGSTSGDSNSSGSDGDLSPADMSATEVSRMDPEHATTEVENGKSPTKPTRVIKPPAYLADFDSLESSDSERLVIDEGPGSPEPAQIPVPIKRKRLSSPKHGNIIRRKRRREGESLVTGTGLSLGQLRMLQGSGKAGPWLVQHASQTKSETSEESKGGEVSQAEEDSSSGQLPQACITAAQDEVRVGRIHVDDSLDQEAWEVKVGQDKSPSSSCYPGTSQLNLKEPAWYNEPAQLAIPSIPKSGEQISKIGKPNVEKILQKTTTNVENFTQQIADAVNSGLQGITEYWLTNTAERILHRQLEEQMELSAWEHQQELQEVQYNNKFAQEEVEEVNRLVVETFVEEALEIQLKQFEKEKKAIIAEVKTKQWCAHCKEEASFFCCWNTTYCSQDCQLAHRSQHVNQCQNHMAHHLSGNADTVPALVRVSSSMISPASPEVVNTMSVQLTQKSPSSPETYG